MFANTLVLNNFILRREKFTILFWFIGIACLVVGFGAALPSLYGSEEGRGSMLAMMDNPAMVAMMGPLFLKDGEFTIGAMYTVFMTVWTAMIFGVMNVFHVLRHTRQDEEKGRLEVIRSLPVGRLSNLSATLLSSVIINVGFAVIMGFFLGLVGAEDMDMTGGMFFCAAVASAGLVFAAITAIICQLCQSPRTAIGYGFAMIVFMYLLRAPGDMNEDMEFLALLSPFGLVMRSKPYIDNNIIPILAAVASAVVLAGIAFKICASRDLGEGIIAAKPGRRDAKPGFKTPGALAWRLCRTTFIIWFFSIPLLGMSYGSIMGDIEGFLQGSPVLLDLTGGDTMVFIGFIIIIMSIVSAIPVMVFMLKARSQEANGYAEHIISRSVSRGEQLFAYFRLALISSVVLPFMNAAGFYAGSAPMMDEPIAFTRLLEACMVFVPAIMFMLGITMLLIAYLPTKTSIAWIYLGIGFFFLYLGIMMGLPEWTQKLSPFGFVPNLANEEMTGGAAAGLGVMAVLSLIMYYFGFDGYKKREMRFSQ